MKRRIRLTEGMLHRIIKESVKRILRENEEYPSSNDLPEILGKMAYYAKKCIDNGVDIEGYFSEIINTSLFSWCFGEGAYFGSHWRFLPDALKKMQSAVIDGIENWDDDFSEWIPEIINTRLFHDACGK